MDQTHPDDIELSLLDAARLLVSDTLSLRDAEVLLADDIQRGKLQANVRRWGAGQWDGRQLPGNINRLETRIRRSALDAWRNAHPEPLQPIVFPRC